MAEPQKLYEAGGVLGREGCAPGVALLGRGRTQHPLSSPPGRPTLHDGSLVRMGLAALTSFPLHGYRPPHRNALAGLTIASLRLHIEFAVNENLHIFLSANIIKLDDTYTFVNDLVD